MSFVYVAVTVISVGSRSAHFSFGPVYGPFRVFALYKGSFYLLLFFLHLLLVGANMFGPV